MKRAGELLKSVFKVLWDKPEGLPAKEVLSQIPQVMRLTEEELKPSSETSSPFYERIVRIATIPVTQAGWLIKNEKGRWFITEDGYQACRKFSNAQDLYKEAIQIYNARKRVTPESIMVMEIARESAWLEIEKYLHHLSHSKLQSMLADLLRAMNYHISWMPHSDNQRGQVDLVAYNDPLGASGQRIVAQIKQKGQAVTQEGVKSFLSILSKNDFGLIVSMSGFTSDAMQELKTEENFHKIIAIDSSAFFDLWKKHYDKLDQEARYMLPLKAILFLSAFE